MANLKTESKILKNVISRFLPKCSSVTFKVNIEGQRLDDKKRFVLGAKAGPSCNISNLFHEMSHFAEREIPKLIKRPSNSWGFSYGKHVEFLGQVYNEPQTDQSVKRELRTWAFQSNLEKEFGIFKGYDELVRSATFLSAWCYYKFEETKAIKTFESSDKIRLNFAEKEVEKLSKEYTLERFENDWNLRIKILDNQ